MECEPLSNKFLFPALQENVSTSACTPLQKVGHAATKQRRQSFYADEKLGKEKSEFFQMTNEECRPSCLKTKYC